MPQWKNINWLKAATVATLLYTVSVVCWIGFDRILRYPTTSSLNEVGDFIAGFFAPLAFVWLVSAVLTQRQELTDTRDQFAENQKVVDAQLKTINEQSVLLQQQHTLAEDTARKTYRLSLFEQRYRLYSDFVSLGNRYKNRHFTDAYWEMTELSARARFVFPEEIQLWFEAIENAIEALSRDRSESMFEDNNAAGVHWWAFRTTEDQERCEQQEEWICEQFTMVAQRSERFESSMRISDN
ncbi:hypothetical protein [Agrobacterium rosae]|uniref:Uncharacterized protein n=1 Tax=Agrobacterium rosae TaxID=1972867 RepID=A0AAE5RXY2_9HYPH|nr:hypothetical protein [Agrobacterium rosae]KAA3511593.1 hypothetical protein DXM21_14200 [Agrobacterium rosae]KAA3518983.1 hypothetical protein DXM25_13815 [Agrobacterium rosae]MQB49289.1 hypothetical protein [Agrobacterium rosae]POO51805.1 hypothetical protein CPJ18_09960 [Agrobacterium rosae]